MKKLEDIQRNTVYVVLDKKEVFLIVGFAERKRRIDFLLFCIPKNAVEINIEIDCIFFLFLLKNRNSSTRNE